MASAEREPITGVWGLCPQRGPGAEPLVRGSGGEAPLKLKLKAFDEAAPKSAFKIRTFSGTDMHL